MMPDDEEEGFDLGIRRKSIDKLTYKNIIADAINWCRKSRGTTRFKYNVQGFESVIMFDVVGYKLKSKLEKIVNQLEIQRQERRNQAKRRHGRDFYGNAFQAKFKIAEEDWYWNMRFEMVIQLLASENLLLETERVIPLRIKKPLDREMEENESRIGDVKESIDEIYD